MRGGLATPRYWWAQPNIFGINGGYNSDPGIYHMLFHGEGIRTLNHWFRFVDNLVLPSVLYYFLYFSVLTAN